jgi:general secretion pathway protein D
VRGLRVARLSWVSEGMVHIGKSSRSRTVAPSACVLALLICAGAFLSSCNSATIGGAAPPEIDVLDKVRSLDILPRQTQAVGSVGANGGERSRAAVYEGTVISDFPEARAQPAAGGNGYDLNFENTPVATVAKVVLGDIMNTGYTIDPRVLHNLLTP